MNLIEFFSLFFFHANIGNRGYDKRLTDSGRNDEDRRRRNFRDNIRASKYDSNRNYSKNLKIDNNDDESSPSPANPRRNNNNNRYPRNNNQNNDTDNGLKAYPRNRDRRNDRPDRIDRYDRFDRYERYDNRDRRRDEPHYNRNTKQNHVAKVELADCSQRERLTREIDTGKLECLICCELIRTHDSVWSCSNCYHIMHLKCVTKWVTSSKSDEGWRCCACQNISKNLPHAYYCFCGKTKDPQYNRNDTAHTCGELCSRIENCSHPCTQLCHPGL